MNTKILPAILFLIAGSCSGDERFARLFGLVNDAGRNVCYLSEERLRRLPKASIDENRTGKVNVPISINQAISSAMKAFEHNYIGWERMDLYWVVLSSSDIEGEEHYRYEVMFYAKKESVETTALPVYILMDGKPVNMCSEEEWERKRPRGSKEEGD